MNFELNLQHSEYHSCTYPLNAEDRALVAHMLPESLQSASPKRIEEFLAGRFCALKAIEKLDVELKDLPVGEHREPIWLEGIVGSIAHTKGIAIAIVGDTKKLQMIGVDIEGIVTTGKRLSVQKTVLTEKDFELMNSFSEDLHNKVFTIIFSAKEAIYKALYPQIKKYFGFHEANIKSIDLDAGKIELIIRDEKFIGIIQTCKDKILTHFEVG